MTIIKGIERIITGQNNLTDIWHYFVGNYRYKLFYANCRKGVICIKPRKHKLMRQHIWEQIIFRIKEMDRECYRTGQCKHCGCATTNLQMANKRCEGICYPTMMNKWEWERFKKGSAFPDINGVWIRRKEMTKENPSGVDTDRHIFYKQTNHSYVPHKRD